ncbi:MAG TPA: sodium-extruding oxaloacetate decarboxylase subunit alpha [Treponemataceae bacterium]|nr:sodium-extruding oxaloacetate decarboxylase subunit alpha [Treponemataceae bacterium]
MAKKVNLTDLVLRDAHQSLHATRMTTADVEPALEMLDNIGYWSLEGWGGATFDSCIRFLNEDPWERLRTFHAKCPNTPIQMLLRGQNLLGYRHYADDVVDKFVEAAANNGVGVFRIFDACNDPRNLQRAAQAAKKTGKHVQMAISYAVTPYHTKEVYADLAKSYQEFGADSICIKDMAGLLKPFEAYDLVKAIKAKVDVPIQIHSHATTGLSVATLLKAAEAGADTLDVAISSMAMGTSHSPTETIVEMLRDTPYDTGLELKPLLEIAAYFKEVRRKYAKFESSFTGADTRILAAQVPGGMLSNLESQLTQQGASEKMDDVLKEIQIVQADAGYIPLVTPTSQIVGTQAVFNVLFGSYENMTQEFRDLLVGKYGASPAAPNKDLVKKALAQSKMDAVITNRPADDIPMEWDTMVKKAKENGGDGSVEDTLTYAMFPKVASDFFVKRSEGPVDSASFVEKKSPVSDNNGGSYTVNVNGSSYAVTAGPASDNMSVTVDGTAYNVSFGSASASAPAPVATTTGSTEIKAPVAGTLLKQVVSAGSNVKEGDTIIIVESMKMELEVKATANGPVSYTVQPGTQISAGQVLGAIGGATAPVAQATPEKQTAPAAPSGGQVVNAPVAGTYLKNAVSEGATVKPGETIVIVESMKMELEVKAASAGTVHFLVQAGTQINAGQPLAEIK